MQPEKLVYKGKGIYKNLAKKKIFKKKFKKLKAVPRRPQNSYQRKEVGEDVCDESSFEHLGLQNY